VHELSIAQSIVETVVSQAQAHQASHVTCVRLRIGELTAIIEDALMFSFEIVAQDTVASGARVEIEAIPWTVRCSECAHEYRVSEGIPTCPDCGHAGGETIAGRELQIVEMDVE
jgi:hydrogenase nickel incorporation protein HypA/HybF